MIISLDWLSEHIDLADLSTEAIADLLTFAGVEVEDIQAPSIHDGVVVGEVLEKKPHPNADKLSVCVVEHGGQRSQVVCGATNFETGSKVPLALPGSVLAEGMKIKQGKLRGVVSEGMLCSGKELGLSPDASGLLLLDSDAPTGSSVNSLVSPDVRLTLEVTPNRPDWLSHLGVARELAAVASRPLQTPAIVESQGPSRAATAAEIRSDADCACPFYTGRIIHGVQVGESPAWLRERLTSVGLRPINNIVDITNFVLMEMGQPLHAFDLAKLEGGIHVRRAQAAETVLALDGETYELAETDTVIADAAKSLAIAGVMGGESSGVIESTTDILLESAYFHPPSIRATSRRLGLSSDSSYRFERGVDPQQVLGASELATRLILELAGGEADAVTQTAGEPPQLVDEVHLDHRQCCRLLGCPIDDATIVKILRGLGLQPREQSAGCSTWRIPSYRLDLLREVDLIEEVARVYGLDRIPARNLALAAIPRSDDEVYDLGMDLKRRLVTLGFFETPTLSMVSEHQIATAVSGCDRQPLLIKNPLGSDYKMLRTSLLSGLAINELASGLLNVASRNANLGATTVRAFELGTTYSQTGEATHLCLLMAGQASEVSWMTPRPRDLTIHDMRGLIEALLPDIPLRLAARNAAELPLSADIYVRTAEGESLLGCFGQCTPRLSREIGFPAVAVAELRLEVLHQTLRRTAKYEENSPYPAITRDVALEVDAEMANQTLSEFLRCYPERLIESFSLFDVFRDETGEKLDAAKKSLAYTITYRAKHKTLESKAVDKAHAKLLQALQNQLGVTIR